MAWIECRFYSEVLELSSTMQVLLPQQPLFQNGTPTVPSAMKHPVLYLLHGLSDDSTAWMRQTAIERYAAPDAYRLAFGSRQQLDGSDNDLMFLAWQLAASPGTCPALYQCCGTEDELYPYNLTFRDHCLALGLPLTYEEEPGDHEWGYGNRKIQQVLDWLPLRNNPE